MSGQPATIPGAAGRFKGRKPGEGRGVVATVLGEALVIPPPISTAPSGPCGAPGQAESIRNVVGVSTCPTTAPVNIQKVGIATTSTTTKIETPRTPFKGKKEVTSGMGKVAPADFVKSSCRPRRKIDNVVCVTESSPIKVLANHFSVKFTPTFPKEIFHYDVVIQSVDGVDSKERSLPDRILPLIWLQFERVNAERLKVATPFDGKKNCYTTQRISFEGQDCFTFILEMKDPDDSEKERRFQITMKLVNVVEVDSFWRFVQSGSGPPAELPQDVIQALDVALRHAPATAYTMSDRSFFSDFQPRALDPLLDLWYGHYQSLCIGCDESVALNMDLATKAFYKKMSVKKFIQIVLKLDEKESFDLDQWDKDSIVRASEHLKGKLIQYGTGKKSGNEYESYHRFPAVGLLKESSVSYSFPSNDGCRITIKEHMEQKNTKIQHPNYPVVHIGSKDKTNYVPLELCSIIPQAYRGKMEPQLTKEMIKGAAVGPIDRFNRIKAARDGCKMEVCKVLKEFGIGINKQMTEITDAKRLHPPRIITKFRSNPADATTPVDPKEGKWKFDGGRQFVTGAVVPKVRVLVACSSRYVRQDTARNFLNELARVGEQLGMVDFKHQAKHAAVETVNEVNQYGPMKGFSEEIAEKLAFMKKKGVELVIVIIGDEGKEYASVKAEAEVRVGILTACIKMRNVTRIKNQTINNFLLKLNSKLNGTNFRIEDLEKKFFGQPIIIFGADVTHPSPKSNTPSIAALTASFNKSGMGFNMHIQPQASRQEVIDGVGEIVEKMMRDFRSKTNRIPVRLVMFRDGVSEGYFDEIKAREYEAIKKVCEALSPDVQIKITFVVVKKRHHTRLQPSNPRDGVGNFCNVPPGTVVDTTIVHPSEQEFFLNSHVGIQGTSKPTRYHVIHDDNEYTTGDLQKLTYYLCYSFVRCTTPVSYPAATYYAHLAAYRARSLIEKDGETADLASLQDQLTIHPDLLNKYPMFFV